MEGRKTPRTCDVCSEVSDQVDKHYSCWLCNGCRAFFKRITLGRVSLAKCKHQGNCEITYDTRKACKKCRYEKCLSRGCDPHKVQGNKSPLQLGNLNANRISPQLQAISYTADRLTRPLPNPFNPMSHFAQSSMQLNTPLQPSPLASHTPMRTPENNLTHAPHLFRPFLPNNGINSMAQSTPTVGSATGVISIPSPIHTHQSLQSEYSPSSRPPHGIQPSLHTFGQWNRPEVTNPYTVNGISPNYPATFATPNANLYSPYPSSPQLFPASMGGQGEHPFPTPPNSTSVYSPHQQFFNYHLRRLSPIFPSGVLSYTPDQMLLTSAAIKTRIDSGYSSPLLKRMRVFSTSETTPRARSKGFLIRDILGEGADKPVESPTPSIAETHKNEATKEEEKSEESMLDDDDFVELDVDGLCEEDENDTTIPLNTTENVTEADRIEEKNNNDETKSQEKEAKSQEKEGNTEELMEETVEDGKKNDCLEVPMEEEREEQKKEEINDMEEEIGKGGEKDCQDVDMKQSGEMKKESEKVERGEVKKKEEIAMEKKAEGDQECVEHEKMIDRKVKEVRDDEGKKDDEEEKEKYEEGEEKKDVKEANEKSEDGEEKKKEDEERKERDRTDSGVGSGSDEIERKDKEG